MTVTYTSHVSTERIGGFFRLLFRWRGSIYSVLYGELAIFIALYASISAIYRFILNDDQQRDFEALCVYFKQFENYVPVSFVVGFYVIRLIARRWTQWENIPWPDKLAFDVSVYVVGNDIKSRMLRRSLIRYANLASVLCFRDICLPVKMRFPTLEHLISSGIMTNPELDLYKKMSSTRDSNWWIPFHWCYTLMRRARKEGKILDEGYSRLQDRIIELKEKCWTLFGHDWIPVPMVYTQVVTLCVYSFLFAALFGRQFVAKKGNDPSDGRWIDLYVPFFTILQNVFYLGWLKVAEVLICPMGTDPDDFEINYIIDRNLNLSYSVVDYNCDKLPPLEKDLYWDNETETVMPHTVESEGLRDQPFIGSTADLPTLQNFDERSGKDFPSPGFFRAFNRRMSRQTSSQVDGRPSRQSSLIARAVTSIMGRRVSATQESSGWPSREPSIRRPTSSVSVGVPINFSTVNNATEFDNKVFIDDEYLYSDFGQETVQSRLSDIKECNEETAINILDMLNANPNANDKDHAEALTSKMVTTSSVVVPRKCKGLDVENVQTDKL